MRRIWWQMIYYFDEGCSALKHNFFFLSLLTTKTIFSLLVWCELDEPWNNNEEKTASWPVARVSRRSSFRSNFFSRIITFFSKMSSPLIHGGSEGWGRLCPHTSSLPCSVFFSLYSRPSHRMMKMKTFSAFFVFFFFLNYPFRLEPMNLFTWNLRLHPIPARFQQ